MSFPRYPEYKDSGQDWLGAIPSHWSVIPLAKIALEPGSLFIDGDWVESKDLADEGIRYITTGNVGEGRYKEQGSGYISQAKFDELRCTEVLPGDVLISRLNLPIGRACVVPDLGERIITSVDNVITRPDSGYSRSYLAYMLSSASHFANMEILARGTTMQRISRSTLGQVRFAFPTTEEQTAIAAFLDRETAKIDALVAEQEELIALLQEKRQAVISHAVTKGLNPNVPMKDSGVEWLGEVPAHWEVRRVKDVSRLESGHTPSKTVPAYWVDCDIPWVSLNDSKYLAANDYITDTAVQINQLGIENSSARLLPAGSVVFTRDATIGLAAITTREMAVSQHLIAWCPTGVMEPLFLLRVFNAMKDHLDSYTFGATIKTIGMSDVKSLVTPVPPLVEQVAIGAYLVDKLAALAQLIKEAARSVELLQERRTALISDTVTGQIDVHGTVAAEAFSEMA